MTMDQTQGLLGAIILVALIGGGLAGIGRWLWQRPTTMNKENGNDVV